MTELKSCPFCGSDDIDAEGWANNEGVTGPACNVCSASAGTIKGLDNIAAWNRRAQPVQEMHELPLDVITLVIAAREFWEANEDMSEESNALDKALETFASRVPYANEPGEGCVSETAKSDTQAGLPITDDTQGTWSDGGKEWTPDEVRFKAGWDKAKQLLKPEDLEGVSTTQAIDHIETLSELLKVIKEHWIDYDHIYSIAVHEADSYVQALKGDQDGE